MTWAQADEYYRVFKLAEAMYGVWRAHEIMQSASFDKDGRISTVADRELNSPAPTRDAGGVE
jgi:hypothetical protein